jgi:hypothetical protein
VPFVLLLMVVLWVTLRFVNPAPPSTIVMTSGADGSMFQVHAGRYAKILAKLVRNGAFGGEREKHGDARCREFHSSASLGRFV